MPLGSGSFKTFLVLNLCSDGGLASGSEELEGSKVIRFLTCFSNALTLIVNLGSNLVVASLNVALSCGIGASKSSLARSSISKNSVL